MPTRSLDAGLQTHLEGEALTLALLAKVVRTDATTLGFTSHDRDLVVSGVTYRALSCADPSALRQEAGSGVDNLEFLGLLQSDAIAESDLRAGRYDGAAVTLYLANWANLAQTPLTLFRGRIGEVELRDGSFRAEVRSLMQHLRQQVGELTSATCTVKELGDTRCKVSLAGFTHNRTVTAVASRRQFTFGSDAAASGYYDYGKVTFTSGPNSGLAREVKSHSLVSGEAVVTVHEALPFDVGVGNNATLIAGCDRRLETCRDKFSNVVNFRGFPHIPGNDKVIQRGRRA